VLDRYAGGHFQYEIMMVHQLTRRCHLAGVDQRWSVDYVDIRAPGAYEAEPPPSK
jgi:hypothetical protein